MMFANGIGIAAAGMVLLIVGLCVLAGIVALGFGLFRFTNPKYNRRMTWALVIIGLSIPLVCCGGPHALFYLEHGRGPIESWEHSRIKEGMSKAQVIAILGKPHNVDVHNPECWYYWDGAIAGTWYMVEFKDEIVTFTAIE